MFAYIIDSIDSVTYAYINWFGVSRVSLDLTQEAMQSSSLLPVKEVRQTIDSRDLFALRLCSMLGKRLTHK